MKVKFKLVRVGFISNAILMTLSLTLLSLAACSKPQTNPDQITIGIKQTISTLDPAMHRERAVESVVRNIFDGLTTRDQNMAVVPELAESWERLDDLRWRFKLRRGVKFHNGDSFTAKDVKFTIDRVITEGAIDGQSSPRKGLLGPVNEVEVEDDYNVLIKTGEPWAILPTMLTFHEIVPKGYIEKMGASHFAQNPIGTGPFKFVQWAKSERIVLQRFDEYYGGAPQIEPVGVAKIKTLTFKPIPEPSSRLAALKAGECDIIQDLPPHLVKKLNDDENVKVLSSEGTRSYFVGMNYAKKPFDDVRVRSAMNYAVNIQQIIDSVLEGMATRLAGALVPSAFGYNQSLKPYPYDPQKARQLLQEAGYPDGFEVEFDTDGDLKEVAEAIANQLAEVVVKAKVRVWEWGVLKPQLEAAKRHMFISSWGNASLDPVGILIPTLKSDGRGNYTGYSNPKVDELLSLASIEMDMEVRSDLFKEVQSLIQQDIPWIFGYSLKEIYAVRKEVKNWQPKPDGMINMHDVYISL